MMKNAIPALFLAVFTTGAYAQLGKKPSPDALRKIRAAQVSAHVARNKFIAKNKKELARQRVAGKTPPPRAKKKSSTSK